MASKKSFFTFILPIKKVYVLVFLEDSVVQSEEGLQQDQVKLFILLNRISYEDTFLHLMY